MKRVLNEMERPPGGFSWVRIDSNTSLLLPSAVAEFRAQENLRRQEAEDSRRLDERHQQQQQLAAQDQRNKLALEAKPRVRRRALRNPPRPGWYRVLPNLGDIEKELDGGKSLAGHSDKDVTERLRKAREALLELGPDRRLAVSKRWREELEVLLAEMPHFRGPIELVKGSLALAETTGKAVRIPPLLLLGPAGVGKTHFSHRLAGLLGVPHGAVAFDQPTYGGALRGTDSAWGNTQTGLLFNLVCLGECANPIILLDEIDKARTGTSRYDVDPLAQLHGALEPESARRIVDISVNVEFDASMTTYIATANSVRGLDAPVLSRFEVFGIEPPTPTESVALARGIAEKSLSRLGLDGRLTLERQAIYLLAHMSPRQMTRAVEKALATAVMEGRSQATEADVWAAIRVGGDGPMLH